MPDYFMVLDSETTIHNNIADLGIVICDRKGNIVNSMGVLVREFYLDRENNPLFHDQTADPLWGKRNLPARYAAYDAMLTDGRRMLASVASVNRWITKACMQYKPMLTAYNLAFDADKAEKSGIDLTMFDKRFCLWYLSIGRFAKTKEYRQFVLDTHGFNSPTKHGNMTYKTNAEIMARFVLGNPDMPDEPHTALEDARDYEVPILVAAVKDRTKKELLNPAGYNWREFQVKDWFMPK